MAEPTLAPYGAWKSPITAGSLAGGTIRLAEIKLDGDDVYWLEGRPAEGGRNVVVRRDATGQTVDITPAGFNVRTRVHEYGGGAYTVVDGVVFFANFADQRLYRQAPGAPPAALTPAGVDMRYADFVFDRRRNRLICVREEHTPNGQVINTLAALPLDGTAGGAEQGGDMSRATVDLRPPGHDFFSNPRLQPRRVPPGLAGLEPSEYALGRHGTVAGWARSGGWAGRRPDGRRRPGGGGQEAPPSPSSSPSGRPTATSISSLTAPAGGICIA